jgi:serine/threonine-protein kinase
MRDASGARIADYVLDGEVPARSFELAYRATHRVLPRCARVVILNPVFVGVQPAELQVIREAAILQTLHHTGVPRIYECGVLERLPWTATEYIAGTSIELAAAERPLAVSDAIAVVRDAAAVLAHAHQRGVVHRHLTPKAIVRTPARGFPICITDWAYASINDSASPHSIDAHARFYRAPELAVDGHADGRADVFSLGAVMFEAATLVLPEPVQKFPGVPEAFHQLLASMLARFPDERPTAAAVHTEATRLVEVFSDGEAAIEEVEVELVDISRSAPLMPNLGWVPPDMASLASQSLGAVRRRKEP